MIPILTSIFGIVFLGFDLHVLEERICSFAFYVALTIAHIRLRIKAYNVRLKKKSKDIFTSEKDILQTYQDGFKTLEKLPSHVSVNFQYAGKIRVKDTVTGKIKDGGYFGTEELYGEVPQEALDINRVANVAAWLSVSPGVNLVSLFDFYGVLKIKQEELRVSLEKRVTELRKLRQSDEKEADCKVVIHIVGEKAKDFQADDKSILHIFLFSRKDGKPYMPTAALGIYEEMKPEPSEQPKSESSSSSAPAKPINPRKTKIPATVVSRHLDFVGMAFKDMTEKPAVASISTEPDMVICMGNITSTLDYLPWHVKLSELCWLPQINQLETTDLLDSFMKFANCEQRFGK